MAPLGRSARTRGWAACGYDPDTQVADYLQRSIDTTELCARYGIARNTGYK